MKLQRVVNFLEKFGTEVMPKESISYVELMMDDHKCFSFNGTEYYVHEDHSTASEDEEEVYEYLLEHHLF